MSKVIFVFKLIEKVYRLITRIFLYLEIPKISSKLKDVSAVVEKTLKLEYELDGIPQPSIEW